MVYVLAENKLTTIKIIDEIKMTNQNLLNTIIYIFCKCNKSIAMTMAKINGNGNDKNQFQCQ
jgi:hypothetical protein